MITEITLSAAFRINGGQGRAGTHARADYSKFKGEMQQLR